MKAQEIYLLIAKDFQQGLDSAEKQRLTDWRQASRENDGLYKDLMLILEQASQSDVPHTPDVHAAWEKLQAELQLRKSNNNAGRIHRSNGSAARRYRWGFAVAASLVLLLSAAWIVYQQAGIVDIVAANGEIYETTLSDGTRLIVNSGSSVSYNDRAHIREVRLKGEAFFEVAADPEKPFYVYTAEARIRVIGTTFNVRSREGATSLTVTEGDVEFASLSAAEQNNVIVSAGMASDCRDGLSPVSAYAVKTALRTGWIRGELYFDRTPLGSIAGELERHYKVELHFAEGVSLDQTFTGSFNRQPLAEVLSAICSAANLKYTISDKRAEISLLE